MPSNNKFPPNSRYAESEIAERKVAGETVKYLRRRFIPPASDFGQLETHIVADHERLDTIASNYFGDPEMYWLICDANGAVDPDELTDLAGRPIRITLPGGIPTGGGDQ